MTLLRFLTVRFSGTFHSFPSLFSATITPVRPRTIFRAATFLILLAACWPFSHTGLYAQTPAVRSSSLATSSKPPDVSAEWKQLVGIYETSKKPSLIIILERDGKLLWLEDKKEFAISPYGTTENRFLLPDRRDFRVEKDTSGAVVRISLPDDYLTRTDAGSDPKRFFHVTPSKPLEELRSEALQASPPKEAGPFRTVDLAELITLDPAIHLDIRYAQSNNFLSAPIYSEARAFMQRPAAEALGRALHQLKALGYGLLILDAYRPWYVTKIFWDATPPADHIFVADPQKGSKHNRGCAVDLTLYVLATGRPIEMTGLYDEMSPRSFPTFIGGTSLERWHRDLLRRAMESEGFTVNEEEWWHFDYKDWRHYPILNIPFEKLGKD